MKNFLIINPFGIGDVLFTTPVVRAIKDNFTDARVGYWCNERVEAILKNNPNINKIFALSRGDLKRIYQNSRLRGMSRFLKLLQGIKGGHYDVAFDFSLDHRHALIAKLLGIKRRIGFNYKKRGRFLTDKIDIEGYHSKHIVEYYLDLLSFIDIKPKSYALELYIPESNRIRIKNLLSSFRIGQNDTVVGIAPGAGRSWGKDAVLKHWPATRFAQLADRLMQELKAKIIILGDETEKPIRDSMLNMMRNKPIDLVGKTTLEDLAATIENLDILITNDGGPLHMAVALAVKTISIFGPVDDRVYGPYPPSPNHIVINKDISCRPCYHNFRLSKCEKNRQCLESISVDEVFEAVRRFS